MSVDEAYVIAIVGTGPRGITLLERLACLAMASDSRRPVEIYAIDAVQPGCGGIWRTDQPEWLLMDNSSDEIAMFSGPPDCGPARPGHGPSFDAWLKDNGKAACGLRVASITYTPRRTYGEYLMFVLRTIAPALPLHVRLHVLCATVTRIERAERGYQLILDRRQPSIRADKVALCTGHALHELDQGQERLSKFARANAPLCYVPPLPAADMVLGGIAPGSTVGILGLGLSFYDVMIMLTQGRGGEFRSRDDGSLRYVASGKEPALIVAGSRTGSPIPVRGVQQRANGYVYEPRLFTEQRVADLRGQRRLDFRRDVYPWIVAEVNLVYFETLLRNQRGERARQRFEAEVVRRSMCELGPLHAIAEASQRLEMMGFPLLELEAIARPFSGRTFAGPNEFTRAVIDNVQLDLTRALRGNVADPVKAALEVLRDTRRIQRLAVDYAGLEPSSHREFVEITSQPLSFLSAGTPIHRSRQLLALIDAGFLRLVGPEVEVEPDRVASKFAMASPRVADSRVLLDALIDARIPKTNISRDSSPLTRQLIQAGIWKSFINRGSVAYDTGGVAVGPSPFHPLDAEDTPQPDLYVLGIPTEHTRWFMQVGIIRPGQAMTGIGLDGHEVAAHIWEAVTR